MLEKKKSLRSIYQLLREVKEISLNPDIKIPDQWQSEEEKKKNHNELSQTIKIMNDGSVEEFMLQDLKPDTQRLEIEEVARVIITPQAVEVYTFDDKVYFIEIGGTKIKKMRWVDTPEGDSELEEECTKIITVKTH